MVKRAVRRWWVAGIVVCLVAGIAVTVVTGGREPAAAVRLLPGTAWLEDQATGAVSRVFGYSGTAEAQVRVGHPGDPFRVVQTADGAYVVDQKTGVISRVGGTSSGVAVASSTTAGGTALQIFNAGDTTWELDPVSGVVSELSAGTLKPNGPQIPLGATTGSAVVDGSGNLWVDVPSRGAVIEVSPGGQQHSHDVGQVGDPVEVAATSSGIWGVDGRLGEILPIADTTGPAVPLASGRVPAGAAAPRVVSLTSSPDVVTVGGGTATDLDTETGQVSSLTSPDLSGATQGVLADGRVYFLDQAHHQVDELTLDPLAPLTKANVPAGSDQLVGKDGLVFANSSGGPSAAVINKSGQVTPITKYQAPTPAKSKDSGTGPATATGPGTAVQSSGLGRGTAPASGGPQIQPMGASAPTTTVPAPTTTVPAPPGQPVVTSFAAAVGQDHTLALVWHAGDGTTPASYKVIVTPQGGGASTTRTEAAGATTDNFSGLTGGTTYCAQVQALSAAGTSGAISAATCAAVALAKPAAAPLNVTLTPDNRTIDVDFQAAPGVDPGTTYVVSGVTSTAQASDCDLMPDHCRPQATTAQAGPVALNIDLPTTPASDAVPNNTGTGISSVNVAVTVAAVNTAGTGPSSASQTSWAYATIGAQLCRDADGYIFEASGQAGSCKTATSIGPTSYGIIPTMPEHPSIPMRAAFGDEGLCSYSTTPGVLTGPYFYETTTPGSFTCPTPPASTGVKWAAGFVLETVWASAGARHTAKVTEYQVTRPDGKPEWVLCTSGETPSQVAGQAVTNPTAVETWYDDA